MSSRQILAARGAILSVFALAAGLSGTTGAWAAFPTQLPFMCFNTAHTFHQTFGPNSFFTAENVQGPTSVQENPPTSKPTVTFPLRQGTAGSHGHTVYYVVTDASDQTLAQSLGVNFTPKLANAGGTAAVQHSSSTDPTAIDVPGDVDFSPTRVLVPSATGFPPTSAAPGAIGSSGYSPLVQLPSGVVINAPQVG